MGGCLGEHAKESVENAEGVSTAALLRMEAASYRRRELGVIFYSVVLLLAGP